MHPRKVQIDDSHIRPQSADLIDRRLAIRTLRHYFELRGSLENRSQPVAAQRIFVGQQNRDFLGSNQWVRMFVWYLIDDNETRCYFSVK